MSTIGLFVSVPANKKLNAKCEQFKKKIEIVAQLVPDKRKEKSEK